jgi:cytosine/adenosine deaminase-related metal-dependent hydrolase
MGFIPALAETRFQQAKTVLNGFLENGFAATSFSPHAPYSVSKEIFELINMHTASQPVTMHNQETLDETHFYLNKTGGFVDFFEGLGIRLDHFTAPNQSSVQAVLPYFNQQQQLILVHNTFTTADDLNWIHQSEASAAWQPPVSFCLCPNANLYIENSLPPIQLLRDAQVAICLGTDSYASNHQLSIVAEINTLLTHFPTLLLDEVLGWATLNGATALQMNQQLGSFEKGKRPGVLQLNVQQHQIASVKRIA